jgi:hypothetical protein
MRYGLFLLVPLAMSAHAEMVYPKGARATITVEYSYQATGQKPETPSDPDAINWRAKRAVTVTATLEAQPAVGVPMLHKQEAQQQADLAGMQKRTEQVMVQTAPMMDAAMAAYEKCGDNEACLEQEIKKMSGAVEQSDVKGARKNVAAISATAASMNDTPRYQRWESVSQAPSPYTIDEEKNIRSHEPGCARNAKATCTTQETLKGGGSLPASNQGSAMFEVDSKDGDIALALPIPLGVLPATFTRTTDDPDQESEQKKTQIVFPSLSGDRSGSMRTPLVVAIKDLRAAAGTLTFPTKGEFAESGTLTVKWRIVPL